MKHKMIISGSFMLACLLLTACSGSQTRTEAEFGDSVRAMTQGQIHDPNAALSPPEEAVTGGDPYALERVLDEYRTGSSSDAASVRKAIELGVGGSSSSSR